MPIPSEWPPIRVDGGARFGFGQLLSRVVLGVFVLGVFWNEPLPADTQEPGWHLVNIPGAWRSVPEGELQPVAGFSWYRCFVKVPASWQGAPVTLYVEALDDARASYVNGVNIGVAGTFPPRYRSGLGAQGRYRVNADVLAFDEFNTIAIRVYQSDPRPNFSVAPPVLLNEDQQQAIRMEGQWQYRPGDDATWSQATAAAVELDSRAPAGANAARFVDVDAVTDVERYVRRRLGDHDPISPREAEKHFEVPSDLQFQLVLSEPEIAQPLFMTWDERGRLWLVEYRQYPNPAGLKMVSRDVYLRTVYDKVPPPPPNHFKGLDRISIHEDTDGDGVYDEHRVFVDGLNIATSLAHGRGGVWVTNPPYLLFYPDRDRDDVPDGDPEVHLQGFGLEDSHSVINSLRFGPDGWLYAAQGSTVTAMVQRPGTDEPPIRTMGQLIWRYHPELKRFEVFAEGGGNAFGVEIDAKGRIFSGHNGGNTRGFHYVQGAYYRKGFGKHGPLSNPYAFGYFEHMPHHSVPRFTHNFVIYEAEALPDHYRGRLFGIEPLQGQVVMSSFEPYQSSFQTADLSRPVKTDDQWFRPVDIKIGPDGCIYVADMYEQRIDHSSHYAGRVDRTNGRIYRLAPSDVGETPAADYAAFHSDQLVRRLEHPNRWHRQTALRILGDRRDLRLVPKLVAAAHAAKGQLALELLWAIHSSGGLSGEAAIDLLFHDDPFVRAWTVRLLGDRKHAPPRIAHGLAELAGREPSIVVRKQLAASARRLPVEVSLPIIRKLLQHDEDLDDIHQPLLLWWALEAKTIDDAGRDLIFDTIFDDQEAWQRPLIRRHLIERLMRRYALSGTRQELLAAAKLLDAAPDRQCAEILLAGFEQAYQGRSLAGIPAQLADAIAKSGGGSTALKLRQGDPEAIRQALAAVTDATVELPQRLQYLEVFGEIRRSESIPVLFEIVENEQDESLVSAALTALQPFGDPRVGSLVIRRLPQLNRDARLVAETLLASRSKWAIELLTAVDSGWLRPSDVSQTALRKMLLHEDSRIQQLVAKHWGSVAGATTEETQREILRIIEVIRAASGNPKLGKALFAERCGKCHTLFGEGGNVGPELTSFQRDDLQRLLVNIINPSAEIREGFENHMLLTADGRVVNGFLADEDRHVVVLRGVDGQNLVFRRDEIEEMQTIQRSVMPEGTLEDLNEQQLRDFFAYFRSSQPVNY